jgi:hypothetical protein
LSFFSTPGPIHGAENHRFFSVLGIKALHLTSPAVILFLIIKNPRGVVGRVPWLLVEGQQAPWLLWPASTFNSDHPTMFAPKLG